MKCVFAKTPKKLCPYHVQNKAWGQSRPAARFHAAQSFIVLIYYYNIYVWPARIVRYSMAEDLSFIVT